MADIGSRAVQPDEPPRVADANRRIRSQLLARQRKPEGEVDQRRHQHHGRRVLDLGLQQEVDGEVPARRITGDDDLLGCEALLLRKPVPAGPHVDGGGGESVTRREAVVDDEHRQPGQP